MSFQERFEAAKALTQQVTTDLAERDELVRREGQAPSRLQATIRRNVHNLEQDVLYLDSRLRIYESEPEKHNLTHTELRKRQDDVGMLKRRVTDLASKLNPQIVEKRKGPATETADTKGKSTTELMQDQEHRIKGFDHQIDTLAKSVRTLAEVGTALNHELSEQEVIVAELGARAEHTQDNISRTDNKLKTVAKKASNRGLYCLIFLLVVVVFLVFYFLYL
ncbi:hypothetical protein RCL1_007374 [Eukaryota sp. TZLM3-RCL]